MKNNTLEIINATLCKTNELLSDLAQLVVIQIQTLQKLIPEEEDDSQEKKEVFDPKSLY